MNHVSNYYVSFLVKDETSHTAAVWLAWKLETRRPCA